MISTTRRPRLRADLVRQIATRHVSLFGTRIRTTPSMSTSSRRSRERRAAIILRTAEPNSAVGDSRLWLLPGADTLRLVTGELLARRSVDISSTRTTARLCTASTRSTSVGGRHGAWRLGRHQEDQCRRFWRRLPSDDCFVRGLHAPSMRQNLTRTLSVLMVKRAHRSDEGTTRQL